MPCATGSEPGEVPEIGADSCLRLEDELFGAAPASALPIAASMSQAGWAPASSSLSGTPKGRSRAMNWPPTSDQDQRAIEEVGQALSSMFARPAA